MPGRAYRGKRYPPKWWEKFLAHPIECDAALMGVVFGSLLLAGQIWTNYDPSPPVAELPQWLGTLMGVMLFGGGVAMLIALLAPLPDIQSEWNLERLALSLSAFGWLFYAGAVYVYDPDYGGALVLGLGLSLGLFARWGVTIIVQRGVEWLLTKLWWRRGQEGRGGKR